MGYKKHGSSKQDGNYRNGVTAKSLLTDEGELDVAIPRDRTGNFEPQLIGKHQCRFPGFDDKILSLYARGMTLREIQSHIEEIYQTEVSADLISTVTDEVMDEVDAWQTRPLDKVYPVLHLDNSTIVASFLMASNATKALKFELYILEEKIYLS